MILPLVSSQASVNLLPAARKSLMRIEITSHLASGWPILQISSAAIGLRYSEVDTASSTIKSWERLSANHETFIPLTSHSIWQVDSPTCVLYPVIIHSAIPAPGPIGALMS